MPIPNRQWLLRARRQMCANYQDLCGIAGNDCARTESGKGATYTKEQRDKLSVAIDSMSTAIDAINEIVELPRGS